MDRNEIEKELGMSYEELTAYLQKKYGLAVCDYFATPEFRSKSKKISRTSEGLFCHHVDEDKFGFLSYPEEARKFSFELQKKERLVYCNYLEHLIFHLKIAVLRQNRRIDKPLEIAENISLGVYQLCDEINIMYLNPDSLRGWKKRCYEEIKDNYEDYIILLKSFLHYIESNYVGCKTEPPFLVPGSVIHFSDCDCEIVSLSSDKERIILKMPSGEEKECNSFIARDQITFADKYEQLVRELSSDYGYLDNMIYRDIQKCDNTRLTEKWMKLFKIDFHGYGFGQFIDIELDTSYGAKNADEYISKALPMYSEADINLDGMLPHFWKGSRMPKTVGNRFYVIRVEASFSIKDNNEPFVRCRHAGLFISDKNIYKTIPQNRIEQRWIVLSTSDHYNKAKDKWYQRYRESSGEIKFFTVTLSLGKNDYLLFKERYDIRYLKILDGCYFC